MKLIKMYAWEKPFKSAIQGILLFIKERQLPFAFCPVSNIAISNNWKLIWKRKMQNFFWHFKNIFVVFIELILCFPFDCCRYKKTRKEVSLFVGHFEFNKHRHYSGHPDAGFCCHHSFLQSSRQRTVCCHGTYFVIMSVGTVQTSVQTYCQLKTYL